MGAPSHSMKINVKSTNSYLKAAMKFGVGHQFDVTIKNLDLKIKIPSDWDMQNKEVPSLTCVPTLEVTTSSGLVNQFIKEPKLSAILAEYLCSHSVLKKIYSTYHLVQTSTSVSKVPIMIYLKKEVASSPLLFDVAVGTCEAPLSCVSAVHLQLAVNP